MRNNKFIIHNNTKSFDDYEIFDFILYVLKQGLLSNNGTQYCYCTVRQFETKELVCEFTKNKNNYRIDLFEIDKRK